MKRILGGAIALIVLAGLTATATASHPTQICIDAEPDRSYSEYNDTEAEALKVGVGATDAGHPPEQDGCVIQGQEGHTQIDFEITGVSDPDDSDTPETPDMSCTTRDGTAFCHVIPPSAEGGDQLIAAWIDFDGDDSTAELDRDEQVDDEDTDATDVALWTWLHIDPPPRRATKITIRFEEGLFRGSVLSSSDRCMRYRLVSLKREREGSDEFVGRTKANLNGRWRFARPEGLTGRIYARVRQYSWMKPTGAYRVCTSDRSRSIQVP